MEIFCIDLTTGSQSSLYSKMINGHVFEDFVGIHLLSRDIQDLCFGRVTASRNARNAKILCETAIDNSYNLNEGYTVNFMRDACNDHA